MDMKTSVVEMDERRLEELAQDPLNIVHKPRAKQTMEIVRSSVMLRLIKRTRAVFARFMRAFPGSSAAVARDYICAAHQDAAECRIRFPLVFLTLTTADLPTRPLHGMQMMVRAFDAFECGLIDSEEDAMNFFFATVLPHSFDPDEILRRVSPVGAQSSDREKLAHRYLMESIELMKSIDPRDGFQADVAGARSVQSVPKRAVRLAVSE
jgi:hypothetical protein